MSTSPTTSLPASAPSEGLRTLLSFLLFLHIFAVLVAVTSRASNAPIESRLREFPGLRQYVQLLALDAQHTYNLTNNLFRMDPDFDVRFNVDLKMPDGTTQTVNWPEVEWSSGQRRQRYETMLLYAASVPRGSAIEGTIPQGVAARLVRERGATGGEIRLQGRRLPAEMFQPIGAEYQTPLRWKILVNDQAVSLVKIESAADSAPVTSPTAPALPALPTLPPASAR